MISISTSQTVLTPLVVSVLAGPALPSEVSNALQSQQFADLLTAIAQALLPLVGSPPLLSASFSHTQPADFKDSGFSVIRLVHHQRDR